MTSIKGKVGQGRRRGGGIKRKKVGGRNRFPAEEAIKTTDMEKILRAESKHTQRYKKKTPLNCKCVERSFIFGENPGMKRVGETR